MHIFCAVFNSSNRAGKEKEKSNYRLPSIVKNNLKERLNYFESEKGKVVSSNFQGRFIWEEARKIKNQNNAFCPYFIVSSHKDLKRKYILYPN